MTGTFEGFPAEGLQFMKDLAANNDREWFTPRKQTYVDKVQAPALDLVVALGERLQTIAPDIVFDTRTNGSGSLMRLYRDTRFSQDKSPYHTYLRLVFWEGAGKRTANPAFYFGIEPDGVAIYVGIHAFDRPMLEVYRGAVADESTGPALVQTLTTIAHAGDYDILAEQYQRVPQGYETDHPRADLLRYKGLAALYRGVDEALLTSPALVDEVIRHCQVMAPLFRWLVDVHGKRAS